MLIAGPGAPPAGERYTMGTPNSWGQMAYDGKSDLIYVPTGNASPDYFGGMRRRFDHEISSSVLALDARTGRPRWRFQAIHNDLWDFDIASQPVLFDWRGRHLLLQPTKSGQLFLLDRLTGQPVSPIRELLFRSRALRRKSVSRRRNPSRSDCRH